MKKLIFLAMLTACGTNEMTNEQKADALVQTEVSEEIPDLSRWQIMPDATDTCSVVSADEMECSSLFQGGDQNCGDATFKFIAKKDGYMYVITLEHVVIRQGEPHTIKFSGKPDTYNIQDQYASDQYHAFQCYGANGEVVRL